tara:strand:+ start:2228 stop:3064 length:837 start_codon:yes stop_codon:yes gene_type:complete
MKLKIKRWDIGTHLKKKPGSIILLLGKRGTGKSVLLQQIAYVMAQNGNIDIAFGFSPTDESNGVLSSFLPKSLIHSEFDETVIQGIMNSQKRALKQDKQLKRVVLFLDDCGYDSAKIFKSKVMKNLFYNGRHYNMGLVMSMQYCMDAGTSFRSNVDITISLKEQIQSNRERLWKQYFGAFESMKEFNLAMNACTNDYSSIVCANNLSQSNELTDSIFWYRAGVNLPHFTLGNTAVKKIDTLCYEDRELILANHHTESKDIDKIVQGDESGKTVIRRRR